MTGYKRFRVVIIGAGFAGVSAARTFARHPVEVLLLDRHNYHTFSPLLHQVATADLEPGQVAYPIRKFLRSWPNVQFLKTEVRAIDWVRQVVKTETAGIPYDFLVVATGSTTQLLNVPGAIEHGWPLKTLEQAVALRNHILYCFEQSIQVANKQRRQQLLTFTVVGGGPTGVELAGALAELVRGTLVRDYPTLDLREVRILLLHSGNSLLNAFSQSLQRYTQQQLSRLGVEVQLQIRVAQVTEDAVRLQDHRAIATGTVVWAAGVRGNAQALQWGLPIASQGKVPVSSTLQVLGHSNVYVVGDLADLEQDGQPLPMLAPVAIEQGKAAAKNILRQIQGKPLKPYRYRHKGTMAMIGRYVAVAQISKIALTGFLAWLLWLGVHLANLAGFHNRLLTLINWIWSYCLQERVARLLFHQEQVSTTNLLPTEPMIKLPLRRS